MTIVNILRTDHQVSIFTDTAVTLHGGGFAVGQTSKVAALPHLNAVIATRGPTDVLAAATRAACFHAASFDGLRRSFARELSAMAYRPDTPPHERAALKSEFDAFVCGWGAGGPKAFAIFSHSAHGIAPWQVLEIPYLLLTPVLMTSELREVEEAADLLAQMPSVMAMQVASYPLITGGKFQQTTITADGIFTRIIGDSGAGESIGAAGENMNGSGGMRSVFG